jgi:hypothetical protein
MLEWSRLMFDRSPPPSAPVVTGEEIAKFLLIYRILARPDGPAEPVGKVETWLEALSRR